MSTSTLLRTGTLPAVNLLPPEIGELRQLRRVKIGLGAGVLASVGVVGAMFLLASGQVSTAQSALDATTADGVSLQTQTAKYADVPLVLAKVDAAELQRAQAMAQEVRWSFYLNDLSLRIPAKVWITSITAAQTSVAGTAVPVAGAAPGASAYPATGIGTVSFEGKAYSHDDVATWLQSLSRQKGFIQPTFTNSTEADELKASSGKPSVNFSSQVTVTDDALSRRFEQKAGG